MKLSKSPMSEKSIKLVSANDLVPGGLYSYAKTYCHNGFYKKKYLAFPFPMSPERNLVYLTAGNDEKFLVLNRLGLPTVFKDLGVRFKIIALLPDSKIYSIIILDEEDNSVLCWAQY